MVTIREQQLFITGTQTIAVPAESKLLSVRIRGIALYVWYLCDTAKPLILKEIKIYGTEHRFEDETPQGFLGTFQDGREVFHAFEVLDA